MLFSPLSHLIISLCNPVKLSEKESGEALPERRPTGNKINFDLFCATIKDNLNIADFMSTGLIDPTSY
jgi:hypothetical protein